MSSWGSSVQSVLGLSLFGLSIFAMGGCADAGARYDEQASLAFRAAWNKRRGGDEAGYRAGMAEVARRRGTWAGERAALDLELVDETDSDSMLSRFIRKAAEAVGDPSKLPAGLPSWKAPAADEHLAPPPIEPRDTEQ